jgi:N-acetylneuraminate lyase
MEMKKYKGLVAAAFTPMHHDLSIAPEKIADVVKYSIRQKFAGLFVVGSTGEFSSLTTEERKIITAEYINAADGNIPIIAHIGSCSVHESILLAEHAVASGADAVCAIAPFYFRPATVRELVNVLKEIGKSCAPTPLFYYHAPACTMVDLPMSDFLKTAIAEIPNFAGIKYTNENLTEYQRCVDISAKHQILFGKDEMLLGALAMGATAGIGTTFNFIPKVYNEIIKSFEANDMARAREWQAHSQALVALLVKYGFSSLKYLMKLAGVDVGPVRLPFPNMSSMEKAAMQYELEKAGLLKYISEPLPALELV